MEKGEEQEKEEGEESQGHDKKFPQLRKLRKFLIFKKFLASSFSSVILSIFLKLADLRQSPPLHLLKAKKTKDCRSNRQQFNCFCFLIHLQFFFVKDDN